MLLALFVLFFTSAIIGIIYSYNSRIFKLAMEEKKNYSNFYNSFREVNTNLYMVKLMNYGFLFENWEWIVYPPYSNIKHTFSAYYEDGSLRDDNENNKLDLEDVKYICLYDTADVVYNNIKNILMNKFDIVGLSFENIPTNFADYNTFGPVDLPGMPQAVTLFYKDRELNAREVVFISKLKIKIKNKIKDTVVFNELEYPIRLKIKYRITGSGDYGDQPPFNVKISMEEI